MAKRHRSSAVESFAELHERLTAYEKEWIFRGHSDPNWRLVPKAGLEPYIGHEELLLELWKRRAAEHLESHVASNDWEWLAIAQHHRLATRLLDWTTNPLIAAYFSVRDPSETDAVIHAARFKPRFNGSADLIPRNQGPLKADGVSIFRPRGIVPRIARPGGLFTVHGPPETPLEPHRDIVSLDQIVISRAYRATLLAELARYGIHSASLFPDLDGLSFYLNWTIESRDFLDEGPLE